MKCSRCDDPAFLRVDDKIVLCVDCWLAIEQRLVDDFELVASFDGGVDRNVDDFEASASAEGATAAVECPSSPEAAAVATISGLGSEGPAVRPGSQGMPAKLDPASL